MQTGEDAGNGEAAHHAFGAQRCAAFHGDGRDGGRRPARGGGGRRHPYGSRPAGRAGARMRACRRAGGARRSACVYRGARHPVAAPSHRAALCRNARHRRRSRAGRRHDGLVRGIHSRLSEHVRAGRPGGRRGSRLSALPAHPYRARLRAGPDRDDGGDALGAHRRGADRGAPQAPAQGRARGEPGQSDRDDDDGGGAGGLDRGRAGRRHPFHLG